MYRALQRFGAPIAAHGVTPDDFAVPGAIYQMGLPPNRIDILTELSGVDYAEARVDTVPGAWAPSSSAASGSTR